MTYISSSFSGGTSVSLLEALSSGLPVVVTDVPSNLEWVQDGYNGNIAPIGDHLKLSVAIIDLLSKSEKMMEMGKINLKIAEEKVCINKNLNRLLDTYEKLLT